MTNRLAATVAAIALISSSAVAEVIAVREAEDTTITCAAKWPNAKMLWASGKYIHPPTWGRAAGDKLEFDLTLDTYQENLKLGVRYAYFAEWHRNDIKTEPGPRELSLIIDGLNRLPVAVPDTKGWNHFGVAEIALPPLQPGYHRLSLESIANFSDTNVDTFIVFREPVKREQTGLLRPTRVVDSDKGIVLCASVEARLTEPVADTYATLKSLCSFMSEDFQTHKDQQIFFHLTDKRRWWNTPADVVLNRYGIYVLADGKPHDRAEWCWTLADYFIRDTGVPSWFAHSSARVMGWTSWLPSLSSSATDEETQKVAQLQEQAAQFLSSPDSTTDKIEVVHLAMQLRFGTDILKRFYAKVAEKRAAIPPGSVFSLNKFETLAILSETTGEDILPYYKRWTGLKDEGPVDPLTIVLQAE